MTARSPFFSPGRAIFSAALFFFICIGQVRAQTAGTTTNAFTGFQETNSFNERVASFYLEPGVKVQVNAPAALPLDRKISLIFYTLPNGNTIPWTVGKKMQPKDDWHYDIQHIGAQTRFLREMLTNRTLVVIYLEANTKSWPAWRKKNGDTNIPGIISTVRKIFSGHPTEVILASHSGGGSFIFGYLNAVAKIPDDLVRIAFLDSNYAYEKSLGHTAKLADWLKRSPEHYLSILAYDDANALLEGKHFVSEQGGTWGRSHAMLKDFSETFHFDKTTDGLLEKDSALDGRFQFLLRSNPEQKIYHTVQVERNGFIQAMVSGTPNEGKGYIYFGDRAYSQRISNK